MPFRHPCTTTEITKTGLIAVGYGCGTIRIFDPAIRVTNDDAEDHLPVLVQVSAHARCITSMSAAKDTDLLLTVSEDSWIRVWRLTSTVIYDKIFHHKPLIFCNTIILDSYVSILLHKRGYNVCGMPIYYQKWIYVLYNSI